MSERIRLQVLSGGRAETKSSNRPQKRADCASVPRPCPYVGCRHNLYLDVVPHARGPRLFINFDGEPHEMRESCALDVAERGGLTLEETSEAMNLTKDRVFHIEAEAKREIRGIHPSRNHLEEAIDARAS